MKHTHTCAENRLTYLATPEAPPTPEATEREEEKTPLEQYAKTIEKIENPEDRRGAEAILDEIRSIDDKIVANQDKIRELVNQMIAIIKDVKRKEAMDEALKDNPFHLLEFDISNDPDHGQYSTLYSFEVPVDKDGKHEPVVIRGESKRLRYEYYAEVGMKPKYFDRNPKTGNHNVGIRFVGIEKNGMAKYTIGVAKDYSYKLSLSQDQPPVKGPVQKSKPPLFMEVNARGNKKFMARENSSDAMKEFAPEDETAEVQAALLRARTEALQEKRRKISDAENVETYNAQLAAEIELGEALREEYNFLEQHKNGALKEEYEKLAEIVYNEERDAKVRRERIAGDIATMKQTTELINTEATQRKERDDEIAITLQRADEKLKNETLILTQKDGDLQAGINVNTEAIKTETDKREARQQEQTKKNTELTNKITTLTKSLEETKKALESMNEKYDAEQKNNRDALAEIKEANQKQKLELDELKTLNRIREELEAEQGALRPTPKPETTETEKQNTFISSEKPSAAQPEEQPVVVVSKQDRAKPDEQKDISNISGTLGGVQKTARPATAPEGTEKEADETLWHPANP